MVISEQTVKTVARLARIAVNNDDLARYTDDLTKIVTLVEQMNALDTKAVDALQHPLDAVARLRDDVITEVNQRETFLQLTPFHERGLYLVPKVIED